jgi:hypothetical protein
MLFHHSPPCRYYAQNLKTNVWGVLLGLLIVLTVCDWLYRTNQFYVYRRQLLLNHRVQERIKQLRSDWASRHDGLVRLVKAPKAGVSAGGGSGKAAVPPAGLNQVATTSVPVTTTGNTDDLARELEIEQLRHKYDLPNPLRFHQCDMIVIFFLCVCVCVCLFVCLSVCLFVCLSFFLLPPLFRMDAFTLLTECHWVTISWI